MGTAARKADVNDVARIGWAQELLKVFTTAEQVELAQRLAGGEDLVSAVTAIAMVSMTESAEAEATAPGATDVAATVTNTNESVIAIPVAPRRVLVREIGDNRWTYTLTSVEFVKVVRIDVPSVREAEQGTARTESSTEYDVRFYGRRVKADGTVRESTSNRLMSLGRWDRAAHVVGTDFTAHVVAAYWMDVREWTRSAHRAAMEFGLTDVTAVPSWDEFAAGLYGSASKTVER